MMKHISAKDLATELESSTPPVVLDVRLADDFEACRIPQAVNNAVYEVVFLDRMKDQLPDQTHPVRVYGACRGSDEGYVAAEKLLRAGYTDVAVLDCGLESWQEAKLPVTCGTPLPETGKCPEGEVPVDLKESRIEWTGRNLLNKHHGCVGLKSGTLEFSEGKLVGGEFVVDLTKLDCTDLAGNELHQVLIDHLQSDDFFDTERFPEAKFEITSVESHGNTPGSPNLRIHGNLTIRDRVHAIVFDASGGLCEDGRPAAQAAFSFDRTLWGVIYGSGKFFKRLAGHLVNDQIEIQLKIVAG